VLITQALEDYTVCFAVLCVLQAAVALPLAGVGDGPPAAAGLGGGRAPPALRACAAGALRHARRACAALLPALRDLWQLLARSRWLPQVLACVMLSTFGFIGAASILVSFVQSEFEWSQGHLEIYMLAVGLPTCIFGAALILGVARPRLGPAGVLCFSQLLMVLAAALLCALPWGEGPVLVLYIMTAVLGTLPTPSFLSMLAHRYPLHEQARVQGLFGAAAAAGAAVALQLYAQVLYDSRAAGARSALPFFVSLGAECAGAALFFSAMWAELPDWATITRSSPEIVIDEDLFQLEWAKRVQPHRPSSDLRDWEAEGQVGHVGAPLRASRGGGIDGRSRAELEHHPEL